MPVFASRIFMALVCVVSAWVSPPALWAQGQVLDQPLALIPWPREVTPASGQWNLKPGCVIWIEAGAEEVKPVAEDLARRLRAATGYPLPVQVTAASQRPREGIVLELRPTLAAQGQEAYELDSRGEALTLAAFTPTGLVRAMATLRQLLPAAAESSQPVQDVSWVVPSLLIRDWPQYGWRGLMLDCARRFRSKAEILKLLEALAYYKINVFHWHLVDDQGWRLEVPKYPRLTQVGAGPGLGPPEDAGGFYSVADVREIVAFAAARHILVVPEIELPGHAGAAVSAYPELSCTGGPFTLPSQPGIYPDIYCPGNDATLQFLEDVLDQAMELFPSPVIHIGGDEAPSTRWKTCPRCQARIQALKLKNTEGLRNWMLSQMETYVIERGRRPMGWDEVFRQGGNRKTILQWWRPNALWLPPRVVAQGRDLVFSPADRFYLTELEKGLDTRRLLETRLSVGDKRLPASQVAQHILGAECAAWGDQDRSTPLDQRIFPRIMGLAEALWNPSDDRSYEDFYQRLRQQDPRLEKLSIRRGKATTDEEPRPR